MYYNFSLLKFRTRLGCPMAKRSAIQRFVAVMCALRAPAILTFQSADFGDFLASSKVFPSFSNFSSNARSHFASLNSAMSSPSQGASFSICSNIFLISLRYSLEATTQPRVYRPTASSRSEESIFSHHAKCSASFPVSMKEVAISDQSGTQPRLIVIGSRGRMPESCQRATGGGFAAKTPQQSGAATTSASVNGTPPSPSLWRTRLLPCSFPPHAVRSILRFCTYRRWPAAGEVSWKG